MNVFNPADVESLVSQYSEKIYAAKELFFQQCVEQLTGVPVGSPLKRYQKAVAEFGLELLEFADGRKAISSNSFSVVYRETWSGLEYKLEVITILQTDKGKIKGADMDQESSAWHKVLREADTQLKAFLLPATVTDDGDQFTLSYPLTHPFHYKMANNRYNDLTKLVEATLARPYNVKLELRGRELD